MAQKPYRFIMISAMYENGGNTTQRFLDGHPELLVYPFESQPGSKHVNDYMSSIFPLKYRWPVFPLHATPEELYELIIDEEGKIRSKTPYVSKFRDAKFEMTDQNRKKDFVAFLKGKELTRGLVMEAFFRATFSAWKNFNFSGKETTYVGYSPIIGVDGDKMISDYGKNGFVIHVVRNPFSAYADTSKRAVPLSIAHYMFGWNTCQQYARIFAAKYPDNFFILRFEDLIENPKKTLSGILKKMSIGTADTLSYPSWNGEKLTEVYPWGTIRTPTPEVNLATAKELSKAQIEEIYLRTKDTASLFGYEEIYKKIK